MALAVHSAVMGSPGEAAVHPFFTTRKERALSQTPSEQLPLNATEKLGFAQSGSENQLPKEVGVSEDKPRKARTTKRASRKDQGTTGQQLQLVPSSVGSSTGQPLLQRPPPRDATLHDNESPNELDDGGGKPRKRRRVSPKPDGDWARSNDRAVQANSRQARQESTHNDHGVVIEPLNLSLEEQLIFAGYSNSSPQKPASIQAQEIQGTMTDELAAGGKAQPSAPSEAPRTPSKRSKVSSTNLTPTKRSPRSAKPIPQKTTPTSKQEKEGQQVSPSKTNTNTPPKKLLKLRNDGKLSSPKRAPTDGVKRQGRMKKSEGGPGDPKEKLVRISYGVDTDSRQAFGQKIESVFSGATPIRTEPKPQAKQSEPPKITHPFFMRKDVKLASATPVIDLEAAKDSAPGTSPKTSPRKKQPATSSWAGFGSSFLKPIKYPGAIEPLWPPQNMLHRRGIPEYHSPEDTLERTQIDQRKFKAAEVRVRSKDEVLRPYQQLVQFCRDTSSSHSYFHRPTRRLLTGPELQGLTKERARSRLPSPDQATTSAQSSLEGVRSDHKVEPATQRVIIDLHSRISTSLSAFDKFECDSQDWAHKYSPKCAVDVLQESNDLLLLRDWLLNFTVNSVDSGKPGSNAQLSAELARKMRMKAKRKRRLQGELSDFLVTVDEGGYNDDLTDPEDLPSETAAASLHRLTASSLYSTKAVVISGPHGCGKTASAYAVAQELGFEIFEINSGTRRSGKDILDKVGDMTRNHLVQQKSGVSDTAEPKEDDFGEVQAEVDSGRQSTMGAFFKSSSKAKPQSKPKKVKKKQAESPKKPRNQRQSVILLEEVDVLFEEDKLFWSTVLTLLVNSRRPIVMTCVDESLLPREEMLNCRALRLSSPSPELAADYLLMMAGNEGHLLSLESLEALYQSQRRDLRASIAHLQFHCQMALGDEKGGLEWMLIRSSQQECHNEKGEQLRVVSDRTFTDYMGVLPDSHEAPSVSELDSDVAVLLEAARDWGYDVGNWNDFVGLSSDLQSSASGNASLETLVSFDLGCDALSAADLLPVSGYFEPCTALMDTSLGALLESAKANYTADLPIINDISQYSSARTLDINLSLKLLARSIAFEQFTSTSQGLTPNDLSSKVTAFTPTLSSLKSHSANALESALDPLSQPSTRTILGHRSPGITTIDQPTSILAVDVAPWVRGIVHFDLQLEQERLKLSGLLSQGGRKGKKQRTTRASRAALEGGRKESTRRERWYDGTLNLAMVVATEGEGWRGAQQEELVGRKKEEITSERIGGLDGAGEGDSDVELRRASREASGSEVSNDSIE